jgi:DNA-binding transcriptional regulator GbsR (MarR family)
MKLAEAKKQFIASWGAFGTHWGINRTMAQVHALLLVSADPLSQDDIMEQLSVSRGNANMNIRELIDWGLVDRVIIPENEENISALKRISGKWLRKLLRSGRKENSNPMLKLLDQLEEVEGDKKDKHIKQFTDTINGIKRFGLQADKMLDVLVKADENWFVGSLMKMFK